MTWGLRLIEISRLVLFAGYLSLSPSQPANTHIIIQLISVFLNLAFGLGSQSLPLDVSLLDAFPFQRER